ncbi:MAG: hypothetical protein AB1644_03470 [Candidatus Zixiibacteriota bacterium]
MFKKLGLVMLMVAAFCLMQIAPAMASDPAKPAAQPEAKKETTAKPMAHQHTYANEVAVCGCGKLFVPDANTKYIEYKGKEYACCTEGCHKMASGNPEAAAKASEEQLAKLMAPATTAEKK